MYPLAMGPKDHIFRKMLVLSGAFHVAAFIVGVVWVSIRVSPLLVAPVTVVDLIGNGQFAASEETQPSPPPVSRTRKAVTRRKAAPAPPAKREKTSAMREATKPREVSPSDTKALSEKIRRMREEKASKARVHEAVETIQREKAVQAAVKGIGERVAHRVDLSAVRPPARGTVQRAPGGMPGTAGTARVAPEILAYARALDEKIRSRWTVPELARKGGQELTVQIRIMIEKDGRVSNVRMEKVSGNPYFDDSVLRAIEKASPLPVPPEQLRGGEDHYEVGFRFHEGSAL